MTDRELLERAAMAAGIDLTWDDHGNAGHWDQWRGLPQWTPWNPLTDDGDALRLAVKLRMSVKNTEIRTSVLGQDWAAVTEPHKDDPYAATRRAIVRAAAAMREEPTDGK